MLMDADSIIGHNILGYDLPVLHKLYSWYNALMLWLILYFLVGSITLTS